MGLSKEVSTQSRLAQTPTFPVELDVRSHLDGSSPGRTIKDNLHAKRRANVPNIRHPCLSGRTAFRGCNISLPPIAAMNRFQSLWPLNHTGGTLHPPANPEIAACFHDEIGSIFSCAPLKLKLGVSSPSQPYISQNCGWLEDGDPLSKRGVD